MKKSWLPLLTVLVLGGAAPGPKPVITLEGVSAAAKLSPELRASIAPHIKSLNARLEKLAELQSKASTSQEAQPAHTHEMMQGMHEAMQGLHEIVQQMTPEQRASFHEYLHARLKAAGIPTTDLLRHHRGTHGDSHLRAA
jgi:hypothetical protein